MYAIPTGPSGLGLFEADDPPQICPCATCNTQLAARGVLSSIELGQDSASENLDRSKSCDLSDSQGTMSSIAELRMAYRCTGTLSYASSYKYHFCEQDGRQVPIYRKKEQSARL